MENRRPVERLDRRYVAGMRRAVHSCEAVQAPQECRRKPSGWKPAVCRSMFMDREEIEREREQSGWNPYVGEEESEQTTAKMRDMKKSGTAGEREQSGRKLCAGEEESVQTTAKSQAVGKTGAAGQQNVKNPAAKKEDIRQTGAAGKQDTENPAAKIQGAKKSTATAAEKGGLPGTAEEDACQCQTCAKPGEYLSGAGCPLPRADYTCMLESLERGREEESDLRRLQTMYPAEAKRLLPFIEDACDRMEYGGSMMFDEHPDPVTISRLQDEISGKSEILSGFAGDPESAGALIRVLLLQEMHRRRSRHRRIAGISG